MSTSVRTGCSTDSSRLMVVDDEPGVARVLASFLAREGWSVATFQDPRAALESALAAPPEVVITDLSMPEMSGLELLSALRAGGVTAPVLVVTAFGSVDSAVAALKLGAFDYLCKPFDLERVRESVFRARLHAQSRRTGNGTVLEETAGRRSLAGLVGAGARMQEVYTLVERAARSQATVLLLGESGTGKELVARALHQLGARARRRFVAVSCAALPAELLESELFGHEKGAFTGANWQRIGRFELADGGTLFLDEIGDISLNVQAKLMRVLQEKEIDRVGGSKPVKVDVRLVAATNKDLPAAIARGEFREDLFYRLRVVEIELPPLRERREDLPLLTAHFLERLNTREGRAVERLSDAAMDLLERHTWPGNVRELENALEHAYVMADEAATVLEPWHLPPNVTGAMPAAACGGPRSLAAALAEYERTLILDALRTAGWDLPAAAAALGLSLEALRYQVRRHQLTGDHRPALTP